MCKPNSTSVSPPNVFSPINECKSIGRDNDTVVADMDGTLLRGRSSFPYFALVAFEVGGVLRLLFLLLASPLAGVLYYFISESAGIQVLIFATFVGMKVLFSYANNCTTFFFGNIVLKFYIYLRT